MTSKLRHYLLYSLLLWLPAACLPVTRENSGATEPTIYATVLDSFRFLAESVAAPETASVSLHYQGPQPGTGDTSKCAMMHLNESQEAMLTTCDGTTTHQPLGERLLLDWAEIQAHFGSFTIETANEALVFQGVGEETGEGWQRAMLAWARVTHAELATDRTSATGRTVLSWFFAPLPEQPDVCTHLTVLNYGYAYADAVSCESGEIIESKSDWLTNTEMVPFDGWLYGRSPLYLDKNYLDGQGTQAMDETESAAVAQWATDVQARIWP